MPRKKIPCPTCDGLMSATSEQCRKCKPSYERTPEHNSKMSQMVSGKPKPHLKGKKRPAHSRNMRKWWDDPHRREQAKERGKKQAADPDWRRKIGESLKGDKNPRWRDGMSATPYAPGFGRSLKRRIRKRDNFTCQLCGVTERELGYNFSIHHADYDRSNHDEDNLHTTCKACNSRVNTNREVWLGYFIAVAKMRRQFGQHINELIGRKVFSQREGFVATSHDGGPLLSDTVFESLTVCCTCIGTV